MKSEFFLTEVAKDWSEHNLTVVQKALRAAEEATLARTNISEDPLLNTPNLRNFRGVLRWVMVQKQFELAVQHGRFDGIAAEWIDLGGAHVFQLIGQHTVVTPCHLLSEDEPPRESAYRKDQRIINQVCPLLWGFEDAADESNDRLQILLVHGGKNGDFAYLRAYTDPIDRSVYRLLSKNIMEMPILLPSIDVEAVPEPLVTLKPAAEDKIAEGEK